MFIKNQTFSDEDTLLEAMFDFDIGRKSPLVQELVSAINQELEEHEEYKKYRDSLTDEDDKAELYIEERDLRLAEIFLQRYDSFVIHSARLYGVKDDARDLLYEIDMV
ncbi:MAG: hypothetical protein JNL72_05225 [Flavipsychrobacter sp.]|nr:hypothetical protein [Flavipsychrobacter sp.]